MLLRCHTGHPSGYVIPLTEVQSAKADQLLQSLLCDFTDSECKIQKIVVSLHTLSVSLLVPQPDLVQLEPEADKGQRWSCPVRCYLAAQAIRDDGNFISPDTLTQKLSRLKYFCRTCALVQADRTKDCFPRGMIE